MSRCDECHEDRPLMPFSNVGWGTKNMCLECALKLWKCDECHFYEKNDAIKYKVQFFLHGSFVNHVICERCFVRWDYTKCEGCGEYYRPARLETIGNGDMVCRDCLENDYFMCDTCNEWCNVDDLADDSDCTCVDCAHDEENIDAVFDEKREMNGICFKHDPEMDKILADSKSEL